MLLVDIDVGDGALARDLLKSVLEVSTILCACEKQTVSTLVRTNAGEGNPYQLYRAR